MGKLYSYEVVQTVYPVAVGNSKPFRIIEKFATCDGTRSRLTDRCYKNLDEARHEAIRLENLQ